jgi:hypothetical protein
MQSFSAFRSKCSNAKCANLLIFATFAFSIFLQCVFCVWFTFHSIPISSIWREPTHFWLFYISKISVALFFASGIFLFKRKYWAIYFSILFDIWILAYAICFSSIGTLDGHTIFLIKFLHGFESSIGMYLTADLLLLLIPPVLTTAAVILFDNRRCEWRLAIAPLILSIAMDVCWTNAFAKTSLGGEEFYLSSFSTNFQNLYRFSRANYTRDTSVLHSFVTSVGEFITIPFEKPYKMTDEEITAASYFVRNDSSEVNPNKKLVLVTVESLENWAITPQTMPNLYHFIENHNTIWAQRVKKQTLAGNSGDGQFIFNTGLLPVSRGAVVNDFYQNEFPSISDCYTNSAMIQPGLLAVWNQGFMNIAYHIDKAYENKYEIDQVTFQILDSIVGEHDYIMAITMASHSPFRGFADYSSLSLPTDMPENMRNYLRCLNYTDSCWGNFLNHFDTDTALANTVVCFMGDHTIFDPMMRAEFQEYCDAKGLDFKPSEAYTAIVAYSPDLTERHTISEEVYQMDAYPTILHLIGAENYYWRGFGANLLDSTACHHRTLSEEDAYILSDKMIRSDYFRTTLGKE